jgi:1,4-alpha-glucan branching enzyme
LVNGDEKNQILVFSRGSFLFVFNFNPAQSFPNYEIRVSKGSYQVVLSTDDEEFGGNNRIDKNYIYHSKLNPNSGNPGFDFITIYIPSRTAMVLGLDKVSCQSENQFKSR